MTLPTTDSSALRREPATDVLAAAAAQPGAPARNRGVPGAASMSVRPLLTGAYRVAQVIGVGPYAVYLAVAGPAARVLAIVAADGIRLPNSVVLGERAACRPFASVRQGHPAIVGSEGVRIGAWAVHVGRWWAPRATRRQVERGVLGAGVAALSAALRGDRVPAAVAADLAGLGDASAARSMPTAMAYAQRLVGFGPGLTPAGDDALCGLLLALHAFDAGDRAWITEFGRQVTAYAIGRTTGLSSALLEYAAAGRAADQVVDVLDVVAGLRPVQPAVDRLLAVGHTSGSCLAAGISVGARTVLAWLDGLRERTRIDPKEQP